MSTTIKRFIQILKNGAWTNIDTFTTGGWKLREILDDEELIQNAAPEGIAQEQYCTYAVVSGKELEELSDKYHNEAVNTAIKNGADTRFDEILAILKNEPQKDIEDSNEWRREDINDAIYSAETISFEANLASMVARNAEVYSGDEYRVVYEIS